jgi:phosphatidate cytidylyltransferase
MAFNWQTFRTRALTAVIFVAVMLAGILWNRWSFFILYSVVHFGAWVEYQRLISRFNPEYEKITPLHRYGVMIGGWCLMLYFTNDELRIGSISLSQVGFWLGLVFMIVLPVIMFIESKLVFLKNIGYSIFGLLYISLPLGLLVNLRNYWNNGLYDSSLAVPLLVIFSLWINDTMAYLVGSIIGRTPLSPISPKKTWEGTIGGIVLTIIAFCFIPYFRHWMPVEDIVVITGLSAISGTFGDLFESKLKRMAGVKDSGSIMPGHGGFLDRFDSLLFAVVVVWFYAVFFLPTNWF